MKTQTIVIALMVVLVVMTGVQAYQIDQVTNIVSSGSVSVAAATSPGASSSVGQSSALSSLPTQVGGCG